MSITANIVERIVYMIESIIEFSDFFTIIILGIGILSFITCHRNPIKIKKALDNFIKNKEDYKGPDVVGFF